MQLPRFLLDDNNVASSMRLFCFISLVQSIIVTFYGLKTEINVYNYIATYLICCFCPKLLQKLAESKGIMNGSGDSTELFQDDSLQQSSSRLYCFVSLLTGISLTWYDLIKRPTTEVFPIALTYLLMCFAPKTIQKFIETPNKEKK